MSPAFNILLLLILTLVIGIPAIGQKNTLPSFEQADSAFMQHDYKNARIYYKLLLTDVSHDALHLNRLGYSAYSIGNYDEAEKYYRRALSAGPSGGLKASILSRLARINASKGRDIEALDNIDSAINAGFYAVTELDTVVDFNKLRSNDRFVQLRDKVFNSLYPCVSDPHTKEFDFWIGEWEVYVTGTNNYAGHSIIQKISGGCALLENWKSSASEGKSLNFIDDSSRTWKQVWVGSYAMGKQDFTNGVYRDSAMRFIFETKDAQGHPQTGRFIFFNQGPDQVRQFNETSADGGKTWVTSYDLTYKRVK